MDATTKRYHLLLIALEARALKIITQLLKRGVPTMRIRREIHIYQVQASLLGGQAALAQLDAKLPDEQEISRGYHTPRPVTLEKAVDIAMLATIVRTALIESYRQVAIATYSANDADGWIWDVEGDHPCAFCLSMDGTIHPITEEFESHPNCRCGTRPYFA